jgi:hypothetical protein
MIELLQTIGPKDQCIQRELASMSAAPRRAAGKSHQAGTLVSSVDVVDGGGTDVGAAGTADAVALEGVADGLTRACGDSAFWNALKKSSAIFLATLSIKREPTCANLPPICALAS